MEDIEYYGSELTNFPDREGCVIMMKVRARRQPEEAEIIIIPMIDTMMFLLMFFIVASLALAVQNGLPVNLPKASHR